MYSYILFDLDGTLTEPYEGIKNSILYALDRLSFKVDESKLKSFIGPPLYKSFMDQCGMSESTAEKAIALYREDFSARGLYENRVYDGIEEVLQSLKETGKHLIVATSKPQVFAEKILAHTALLPFNPAHRVVLAVGVVVAVLGISDLVPRENQGDPLGYH